MPAETDGSQLVSKKNLVTDAMVITNRATLDRLVELAIKRQWIVWIAPAVRDEMGERGKDLPEGTQVYALTPKDVEEVERLLARTSRRGKELVQDLRRRKKVGGLGEVESMVVAKRMGGVFVSDDQKACKVAALYLGSQNRALSSREAIRLVDGVDHD